MNYYEVGKTYEDGRTGYQFRFDIVPDEVPESFVRTTTSRVFILQAHKDSNPEQMLNKLRKLWDEGLEPMRQDGDPAPTLEEECRRCGWDYGKLKRQIDATTKAGRTLTPEELEAV